MEDANLHGGWLTAWGRPGLGAQFRLTLPRRLGMVLRTSPLPLVPRDLVPAIGTGIRTITPDTDQQLASDGDATVPRPSDQAAVR
jgi:two-component system sensor histidine kinase MtrB